MSYPNGFRECWGDYREEEDLEVASQPLYQHQKRLPNLPVPSLEETCALYLQTVRPLATDAEFEATKKAVKEFLSGPLGPELQRRLVERAASRPTTSYLAEWWNTLGYLQVRDPVVFYVSYFFHFSDAAHALQRSQVGRAASLLVATMEFRNQVASGTRPPETLGRGKTPLCSTAYKYMFNACRIPHREADSYRIYDPSLNHHVVVMRHNKFFKVNQPSTPLTFLEWTSVLEKIIAMAGAKESSIGVLSSQDRDIWADGREQLLVDGNEASLRDIESAVCIVCLDDETPVSRTEVARALWHGNGRNRFYDKTIQLIVFENGKAGILAEHSMLDGMAMSVYADYILSGLRNQTIDLGSMTVDHATLVSRLPKVNQIPFKVSRATLLNIERAEHSFDLAVDDHELHVESFYGYGNNLMKTFKCSPDAYVQMAIQLAARKFWGKDVGTYEASQVRPYLHGRTETTRSCSIASKAFVDTMVKAAPIEKLAEKAKLCRDACNSHVNYMKRAAQSKGVDRHFLGLRLLLKPGESAAIFDDPLFARSKYWQISTSHLTNELFDGWGWGEVVSDGVGIAYSIKKNSVHFNIACRKTIPLSMSRSFGHLLEESLLEMRAVFEAEKDLKLPAKLQTTSFFILLAMAFITAYKGVVVHSLGFGTLQVLQRGLIGATEGGKIEFVHDLDQVDIDTIAFDQLVDYGNKLLLPGFVDGHAHAPQYSFLGIGMHLPLLDWLNTYTFPHEAKFADVEYARSMYTKAVTRHVRNGTTTCSYFATIHLEACKELVDIVQSIGQRGYIGKVNMDRNATPELTETTEQSLADTASFIEYVQEKKDDLITPVITPRFVPSTTSELMYGLAELSHAHSLPVQSHLSENTNEILWIRDLHPECNSYTEVYDAHGLLHERSYMAHCIWCSSDERTLLKNKKTAIIHCPNSNFSLTSGVLNVRRCLREGLKVGLGSDVSGGYTTSMLDALRNTVIASKLVAMGQGSGKEADDVQETPLSYAEAFHLATVGGAECLNLQDKIGNFVAGKELDMLVVDLEAPDSPVDEFEHDDALSRFQKFLFVGDDRNITHVYVRGRLVHER